MSHPTNLDMSPFCYDVIFNTFTFIKPETNIKTMTLICQRWREIALTVAKLQRLTLAEDSLNEQMSTFLAMTGGQAIDYCPDLRKLKDDQTTLSMKEIHDRLTKGFFAERHEVSLGHAHIVTQRPEGELESLKAMLAGAQLTGSIPELTEEESNLQMSSLNTFAESLSLEGNLLGKVFIRLDIPYNEESNEECLKQWISGGIAFFPIGLFNLKIQGEDHQIIGEKNRGNYCLSLKGKLIEFIIIPHIENISPTAILSRPLNASTYFDPSLHAFATPQLARNLSGLV